MGELPASFGRATAANVSDALDEHGIPGVLVGLTPRHGIGGTVVGRALPVAFTRKSSEEADRFGGGVGRPLEMVLRTMQEGDFVLFDLDGSFDSACWGGLASRLACDRGVAGVGVWGACRDLEEIVQIGFPVWSRAVCPRRSRNDFTFGSINEPITVGAVTVEPGDVVVADASGVVVVPGDRGAEVADTVERIVAQEQQLESQISAAADIDWDAI